MVSQLIDQTVVRFPRFAGSAIAVEPLEKGGSDRSYYRIAVGGDALILAKYGSLREENRHYVAIARFLRSLEVRVPEIYFHDEAEGLIWMEDLGGDDLWSFREQTWAVRRPLYHATLDQVARLHMRGHHVPAEQAPKLQAEFNRDLYRWEQNYFVENCLERYFGVSVEDFAALGCGARLEEIAAQLHELPRVFVHRDFQSQNVVVKKGEACLIDFQGMRPGLAHYDLASLLYDPYVQLSAAERTELLLHYLAQTSEGSEAEPAPDFLEVYHLCAMQRLMQALGAYGFLGIVKERKHFLEHIPPALVNLSEVLSRISGMQPLGALLAKLSPAQG